MVFSSGKITNINFAAGSGQPVFNVKSSPFNATGNGSTNDRAALQAAIDAASTVHGTVFIPVGNYKIDSSLVITEPISIVGEYVAYGRRQSNNNWDCFGSVIWNSSATGNTITYNPAHVGDHVGSGLVIKSVGISTPPPSTDYFYQSWDIPGWGPHSTGTGIFLGQYAYMCFIDDCFVTRHAVGIDLNNGSTTVSYNAFNSVRRSIVAICKSIGINAGGIDHKIVETEVLCNDAEWNSDDSNPAQGGVGISLTAGNSSFVRSCLVINYQYGYQGLVPSYGHQLVDNFADACKYPYHFTTNDHSLIGCGGTATYWNPSLPAWPTAETGITVKSSTRVQGCHIYRGKIGCDISGSTSVVNGNIFQTENAGLRISSGTSSVAVTGNTLGGAASVDFGISGTSNHVFTGNIMSAATTGVEGSAKFRGNAGKLDAG